jgi:hypothetical protein
MEIFVLSFSLAVGLPLIMAWLAWTDDGSGHRPTH